MSVTMGGKLIDYLGLPQNLRAGMKRYIEDGQQPGGFLTACIENNFVWAVSRADDENRAALSDIALWFCNEIPPMCWGLREKRIAWQTVRQTLQAETPEVTA